MIFCAADRNTNLPKFAIPISATVLSPGAARSTAKFATPREWSTAVSSLTNRVKISVQELIIFKV